MQAFLLCAISCTYATAGPDADIMSAHVKDLTNRLDEHNSGETISIRNGIPWEVAWFCKVDSKTEAIALENRIKKRGASRFIIDQS